MNVNKIQLLNDGFINKELVIPIELTWDYLGLDQSIDEYEQEIITEVIGVGRDFEVDRFSNEKFSGSSEETAIKYQFYFYSGGSMSDVNNWNMDYRGEGFNTQDIFYYKSNFSNSFFKLDLYDSADDKKQKNYITIIIPTQQGLKMDAVMQRTSVSIKKPEFVLDFIGDIEGFFIYWLKKRTFLDINTFFMSAKFYNAETGRFTKMMNTSQGSISGNKYSFDNLTYFYYKVVLDYEKRTYQVFNINPNITLYSANGQRAGTPVPIKWFEYVNP
jgi:hypothetical protein